MSLPRLVRQWDIFRANLGEESDLWLLVLSSTETNEILGSTLVACEVIPATIHGPKASPLVIPADPPATGLPWPAALAVRTLASIPRNCLVSLDGRLEPASLRGAALRGVNVLFGQEPWPL